MQHNQSYQVAIVGGGLAGLCMAIQCATQGYTTIVFEKEQYPFHKVCGEYISMESHAFLQRLGFNPAAFGVPYINQLYVSDVAGKGYNFRLPLGGFGISRYSLDYALYQIAVHKGVAFVHEKVNDVRLEGEQFVIESQLHPCTAAVVVGSFGKRSNLDVKWKRSFTEKKTSGENYIGVKYHVRYPQQANQIALHNFKNGYCGISKIEDEKCCLCYLTTAKELKAAGGSIDKMEQTLLAKNPQLKRIFSTAEFLYDEPLAISQISFQPKVNVQNHVLLVGDAAGLITPLCGNGMSMAIHGSKICFQVVNDFMQKRIGRKEMEREYSRLWKQQFASRLYWGRLVQRFFGDPATTGIFLRMMNMLPPLSRQLIRSTHGKPF
ncbi:NAD(P)/FAD-dependent oxidoreductase [Aridibaculum aurantiacum]|uniref:NAD(P)/FAD-dependent oxidoreductase n=1 Tax=Aridibaculum aurantiacum TaxID=2810307 RepID=UPI001A96A019|nr:FAD-binding protein [Aridibaculum aurantiacum]